MKSKATLTPEQLVNLSEALDERLEIVEKEGDILEAIFAKMHAIAEGAKFNRKMTKSFRKQGWID